MQTKRKYDGFISYSTAADADIAPKVQDALEGLAKPWKKRRALKVFQDADDLPATSDIDDKLLKTLSETKTLIYLASQGSAQSKYCNDELRYWLTERSADELVIVLTDGTLEFERSALGSPGFASGTAASEALGLLQKVPLYIDLRDFKKGEETPTYRDDPEFRVKLTQLAAAVHTNKVREEGDDPAAEVLPRDIDSADRTQHRKARRARRIAIILLTILTIAAAIAAVVADQERRTAEANARESSSRALASDARDIFDEEPDLGALLALEALRVDETGDAQGALMSTLSTPTRFQQRTSAHDAPVYAIAFSGNGLLAATADASGALVVWDLDPDNPLAPPQERWSAPQALSAGITDLFFDGETGEIGVVASDSSLAGFDAASGALTFEGQFTVDAFAAALSPSGRFTATVGESGRIEVWGPDGLAETTTLRSDMELLTTIPKIVFHQNEGILAWTEGNVVWLWDWDAGAEPEPVEVAGHGDIFSIAASAERDAIAVGMESGFVLHFSLETLELYGFDAVTAGFPASTSEVHSLAFAPGSSVDLIDGAPGQLLVSTHANGDVNLWLVIDGTPSLVETLLGHNEFALAAGFGPGGRLATGSFDGEVLWWTEVPLVYLGTSLINETHDALPLGGVRGIDLVGDLLFSFDGVGRVLSTDASNTVLIDDGEIAPSLALSSSTEWLAVADAGGGVVAINLSTDDGSGDYQYFHDAPVIDVEVNLEGDLVASLDAQGGVTLVNLRESEPIGSMSFTDMDFSAQVLLFASPSQLWVGGQGSSGPAIVVLDTNDGTVVEVLSHSKEEGEWVMSLALSNDGTTVASGGSDREIYLWDIAAHARVGQAFIGHREYVTDLAFTPDDLSLLASDRDGTILLWDIETRTPVGALWGPTDDVTGIELSDDGMLLVASSEDGQLYSWTMDPAEWVDRACLLSGRNMSPMEWDQFGDGGDYVRHCRTQPMPADAPPGRDAEYDTELPGG